MYVTASSTKSNQGNIQIHRVAVFAKIIGNDWCYAVFIFQPFPFRITPLKNLMLLNKQIMKIAQPLQFQHSVHTRSLLVCQSFTLRRCVTEASICTRELLSAAQSPGLCPKAGSSLSYWDKQQRKAKLKLNEVDIFFWALQSRQSQVLQNYSSPVYSQRLTKWDLYMAIYKSSFSK